jgi:HSP20 family molecular chaperone IbpA
VPFAAAREEPDAFVLTFELPGVEAKDEVEFDYPTEQVLRLRATPRSKTGTNVGTQPFACGLTLPGGDVRHPTNVELNHGVLTVKVPKDPKGRDGRGYT